MVTKIHRDALRSEAASLKALMARSEAGDPMGYRSMRGRLKSLEAEINLVEGQQNNFASVALVFDGDPVRGSSAIEVGFAGKALQDYQELIAKNVAVEGGQLVERGRLSDQIHKQAKLNITALVHGSFGFVLEEDSDGQLGMFETPAQKAVHAVTDLLGDVSTTDDRVFEAKLDDLDVRVFSTLKRFISTLHKAGSTLRIAEELREVKLDLGAVERAFKRVTDVEVSEQDETLDGELLGLVPIQRRFEFRRRDTNQVLQGRVAANLSADYLERIEREGLVAGDGWRATIRTKSVEHPDRRHSKLSLTLIDLVRM